MAELIGKWVTFQFQSYKIKHECVLYNIYNIYIYIYIIILYHILYYIIYYTIYIYIYHFILYYTNSILYIERYIILYHITIESRGVLPRVSHSVG